MSGRDIGNILEIMRRDLKASFSNPIVVIVLVAIIILPSLYALMNIEACWNPYDNTKDVQFAIVNLDKGANYEGEQINVGNELVKELKKNDDFDWVFVSEDELRDGVYVGQYYAGIIIPENLSENVISITTDDPETAQLEYVVNIKANPVASKLTDSAANAVYRTMNAKIVEFINIAAYGKLGDLQSSLASGAGQLSSGANQLSSGASKVSAGSSELSNGATQVLDGSSKVLEGSAAVNEGAAKVSSSNSKVQQGSSQVQQGASEIESAVDPSLLPDGPIKQVVQGSISLANASSQVAQGSGELANGSVNLAQSSSKLANGASDVAIGSDELAIGALSLAAGSELLSNSAAQALISAASALSGASGSLADVTGLNESQLGNYIYSPVKLDRQEIFPVPDYGSSVAPFYLVLSMWVGAVITCVMLKPGISSGTKYSPLEMYFGKLALFILMSLLQAAVTISGIFIMGVTIRTPILFIFSAALVSMMFMILIYSLISALGQVGKGISVILLVLQISGTGGIYPIEIMGDFFQLLYPFLPMTYAINLIRESMLGLVWSNYAVALFILVAMGIITVIVAIIIKEKADHAAHYFEERLEETKLF